MDLNKEKRTRTLFFVVDTSSGMMGGGVESVNRTINDVIQEFRAISIQHDDLSFKIAVLAFSGESATWLTPKPVDAAGYTCNLNAKLEGAKISAAFKELSEKLSSNDFMGDTASISIILLAHHKLDDDYDKTLNVLKTNERFKNACKYAIAIGSDIDNAVLEKFTGSTETVPPPVFNFDHLYWIVYGMSTQAARRLAYGYIRGEGKHI